MKYFLILFSVMAACSSIFAQQGKLSGKVIDEKGEPIMGASIIFRGDVTIGTLTDDKGNYIMDLPAGV